MELLCPACGYTAWEPHYVGPVRAGKFGNLTSEMTVHRCVECGLKYLDAPKVDYESEAYRVLVEDLPEVRAYQQAHDREQAERLGVVPLQTFRDCVAIDVGAGAGSFLDAVSGFTSDTVAVEPSAHFHAHLASKGHKVFSYGSDALRAYKGRADIVTSFAVIEHVDEPRQFVKEALELCRSGGKVCFSTPNAEDWLVDFLPGSYDRFFYRSVHRWYFNGACLVRMLESLGAVDVKLHYYQRFDVANALRWIRDQRPTGLGDASFLFEPLNEQFRRLLEESGKSDYLFVTATSGSSS